MYCMRKNRTFDKNQIVVVCLFCICLMLVLIIFFISNRTVPTAKDMDACVTREAVATAYAFLSQQEAVDAALEAVDEPLTYGDYRQFLEQLHLWDAGAFEELLDWDAQKDVAVSMEWLIQSRDKIAELFEMTAPVEEMAEESFTEETATLSQIDEHTMIRVLLLQEGEPLAKDIFFSANEQYTIEFRGKKKTKSKNKIISAGQLKLSVGQTALVYSDTGKVYLADANGNRDTLGYSGSFRITRYTEGYAVVNEVAIEDYLYGVVQSEMPGFFEKEALKAQAVCARTYIVTQLNQENYPQYGADVDDSVRFQAYNQAAPDVRVVEAVDATKGKIIVKDQMPIHAYFFSTSFGMTSGRELWGMEDLDYLQPVRGNESGDKIDLSDEETFRTYIRKEVEDDYDAQSSYYRWRATLDIGEHSAEIKALFRGIDEAQPECVIIRDSSGNATSAAKLADWKAAQQLKVLERSETGAVLRLLISFADGEVEVSNENCIRQILGMWMNLLQDKDGNQVMTSTGMLPSVYFYVQPVKEGIVLFGGGLGHGIGMSQYGANGMAQRGAGMQEILNFYYQDIELYQLYEDVT